MTTLFSPALRLLILLTLLTGAAYPALGTWLAQSLFPAQANGSLVYAQKRTVGSALIGQSFTRADYFWSRRRPLPMTRPTRVAATSGR